MALWRDPLDELIDELDRAVPSRQPAACEVVDLYLMQQYVTTLVYGSDDDRARMVTGPWFAEWKLQWDRFSAGRSSRYKHEPKRL